MDKKQKSLVKSKEKKNLNIKIKKYNKELFPHKTKFNNLKSEKYFSITNINSDVMKKALIKYREDSLSNKSQHEVTNSITSPSTCNISKINQNNSKKDKFTIDLHEPKTKTIFKKLAPKNLELNQNDDIEMKIFNYKKNFNLKKRNKVEEKNHKKYISEIKERVKVSIDSISDDEDSMDFDINSEKNNEVNFYKNNLTDRNKNNINININLHDINFIDCIKIENLYNELIKDLEINKMNKFENKLNIIKKFLNIFNDNKNQNLFLCIDMNSLVTSSNNNIINKDNNIFLMLKEYLIQQIIFFYIIILIGLIKNEQDKNIYLSGLQNLSVYFHQNSQVFNFILISKVNKNIINLLCDKDEVNYEKCLNMVKENKTWLNQNNYYKYLQINNKMSKQVINNLFEQIRIYFNSKNYANSNINGIKIENKNKIVKINKKTSNINLNKSKNKKVYKDTNNNNIQKDFINSDINLFLEYIKSFKKAKFTSLLKDLKYSPSINYLNDKIKLLEKDTNINSIKNNNNNNTKNIDENKLKVPFLKPINPKYKYTLVLDLDETLIHYKPIENIEYIQIRPGAEDFIKELSEFYEIIIFTASLKRYADLVIKGIDIDNKISGRLYREHTMKIGNSNIKDLNKLGRDLKKVIIIENSPENYNLQPKNGINVIDFDGNEYDDILYYLKNDLIKLAKLEPEDVRNYLKEIQINMNKRANELINMCRKNNNNFINCNNQINEYEFNDKKTIINKKILEKINEYEFENTMNKEKNQKNNK